MKLAIKKAKLVAKFFNQMTDGCIRDEELKERLLMAKENNPEFFAENADMIRSEMMKRKMSGMKGLVEVAKATTKDSIKKLEQLKELGKTHLSLEHKK